MKLYYAIYDAETIIGCWLRVDGSQVVWLGMVRVETKVDFQSCQESENVPPPNRKRKSFR